MVLSDSKLTCVVGSDIIRRQEKALASLPCKMKDRIDEWVFDRHPSANYRALNRHLDSQYNIFLLHRLLVKRLHVSPVELLRVSLSMLRVMNILCGYRHRMDLLAADLPWIVSVQILRPKQTVTNFTFIDRSLRAPPSRGASTRTAPPT